MLGIVLVSVLIGGCGMTITTAEGGTTPMRCHWTFLVVPAIGLAGLVMALCATLAKTTEGRRFSLLGVMLTALLAAYTCSSLGIGVCSGSDCTTCQTSGMWVEILGIVSALLAIVMLFLANPKTAQMPKRGL